MSKKLTKRDLFELAFDIVSDSDAVPSDKEMVCDFIVHELALLDRKRTAKSGPTKTQLENIELKKEIVAVLSAAPEPMKATPIGQSVGLTVQRTSALLKQLVTAGEVERIVNGKETTFRVY